MNIRRKQLWYDTAKWFACLSRDDAIHLLLERLGTLHHADRTWLTQTNLRQHTTRITHEWCGEGIPPALAKGRDLSLDTYRSMLRRLENSKEVYIPTPLNIAPRYQDLRTRLAVQGVRSLYCVPILSAKGRLIAALGHHKVLSYHRWSRLERSEMRQAAGVIRGYLLAQARKQVVQSANTTDNTPNVFVKQGSISKALSISQITCIEASLNYTRVHLLKGHPITKYRSMERWEKMLPEKHFLRIHRSYIINIAKVVELNRNGGAWQLTMADKSVLSVGRMYRKKLLQRIKTQGRAI
ncbi:MAG: LytTR family transcriptional regulator [Verrucomicrobiales bacterium]|jgi:hypothetical protein|nr:LytTR family transcriptional regulator [Verrucomicrobiales bacterium]